MNVIITLILGCILVLVCNIVDGATITLPRLPGYAPVNSWWYSNGAPLRFYLRAVEIGKNTPNTLYTGWVGFQPTSFSPSIRSTGDVIAPLIVLNSGDDPTACNITFTRSNTGIKYNGSVIILEDNANTGCSYYEKAINIGKTGAIGVIFSSAATNPTLRDFPARIIDDPYKLQTIWSVAVPPSDVVYIAPYLKPGYSSQFTANVTFRGSGRMSLDDKERLNIISNSISLTYPRHYTIYKPPFASHIRSLEDANNTLLDPCYDRIFGIWCEYGKIINIDWSQLGAKFKHGINKMPDALGEFTTLKSLYLSYNFFRGQIIPDSMCNGMPDLLILDISTQTDDQYDLPDTNSIYFPNNDCFNSSKMPNLSYLDINSLQLVDFPPALEKHPRLLIFDASTNRINLLPSDFSSLTQLNVLKLGTENINQPFPTFNNPSLRVLALVGLNSNYTTVFPTNFFNSVRYLNYLDLHGNNLFGPLPSLSTYSLLSYVDLSYNQFYGPIPSQWSIGARYVETLILNNNYITSPILPLASNTVNLKRINMAYNRLSLYGAGLSGNNNNSAYFITSAIHVNVLSIDFSYNQLTGPLPSGYFIEYNTIQQLNLAGNALTAIAADVYTIPTLTALDISNQVSGSLEGSLPVLPPPPGLLVLNAAGNPNFHSDSLPRWLIPQPIFQYIPGATYTCPALISAVNQFAQITFDASYYAYENCRCVGGLYGIPPDCISIPDKAVTINPLQPTPSLQLTGQETVPPYSISDGWYGTNRLLSGVAAQWTIDASNVAVIPNVNITESNVFFTQPIPLNAAAAYANSQRVRIINLYLSLNLDFFIHANDSIDIYEGDENLLGNRIATFRGSDQLLPKTMFTNNNNNNPIRLDQDLFHTVYTNKYNFPNNLTINIPIFSPIATIAYNSRQSSNELFFIAYNYESDCRLYNGYQYDKITDLCIPISAVPILPISNAVTITMIVLSALIMFCVLCVLILTIYAHSSIILRASAPNFLYLFLIGGLCMIASIIVRSIESSSLIYNDISMYNNDLSLASLELLDKMRCNMRIAELWLLNVGYTLLIGSLLVKNYRISIIFNTSKLDEIAKKSSVLHDKHLFLILFLLIVIESIALIGLTFGLNYNVGLIEENSNHTQSLIRCEANMESSISGVILFLRFSLILISCLYSYYIRDAPSAFNESKQLGLTCYNLAFLSVLLPIIENFTSRGSSTGFIVYSLALFVLVISVVLIMYVPKLIALKHGVNKDSVNFTTGSGSNQLSREQSYNSRTKNTGNNSSGVGGHTPGLNLSSAVAKNNAMTGDTIKGTNNSNRALISRSPPSPPQQPLKPNNNENITQI